jgi:hypothetical protein
MNEEKTDEALKADESQIEVESPATEVLPAESQTEEEASESTEEETPEAEVSDTGRKTASSRIQELVAQKKEAQKEAEEARTQAGSLAEQVRQFTAPQVPNYVPSQESAESGEVTVQEVLRQADALTQIRLAQQDNLHRVNNEANEATKEYPELDPKSDSFDPELSESVSRATLAQITVNPTASVKGFVSSLMKPYRRSLEKQVAGQQETITKQVSEQAMRPTQVQEQEKPFSELSIDEMEKKLTKHYR